VPSVQKWDTIGLMDSKAVDEGPPLPTTPCRGQTVSDLTPMLKQYMGMKSEYPDSILFFRMGDFYEMFL